MNKILIKIHVALIHSTNFWAYNGPIKALSQNGLEEYELSSENFKIESHTELSCTSILVKDYWRSEDLLKTYRQPLSMHSLLWVSFIDRRFSLLRM